MSDLWRALLRGSTGCVILAVSLAAGAPAGVSPVIPATGLRADAAIVRDAFAALHPGLLRYQTQAGIDSAFAALADTFAFDRTRADAFVAFSRLTAGLRCGHTWPSFFNQRDSVDAELFRVPGVPFHFLWLGRSMIVTRSFTSDPAIRPGVEILALDGVPAATVLEQLMPLARADGGNDAKRRAELAVAGTSRIEAFDVFHSLRFDGDTTSIVLDVRSPAGSRQRVTVQRMNPSARFAAAHPGDPARTDSSALWTFEWAEPKIAVLRMPTWATYDHKWDWRSWLARRFAELDGRPGATLVIDLRGNEGGTDDVGRQLLAYLTPDPLPEASLERRVRFRSVPDSLRPFLKTWDPSFYTLGAGGTDLGNGWLRLPSSDDASGRITPARPTFRGRTFVLIGPDNSSATFQFAQLARVHKLATLVGQPTGGNRRGINGGALFFLRLPHSGIEIDLPLIGYFPETKEPDAGLEPDVAVIPTVAGIAAGVDEEWKAVRSALRQQEPRTTRR